jgi:hypothetical protein
LRTEEADIKPSLSLNDIEALVEDEPSPEKEKAKPAVIQEEPVKSTFIPPRLRRRSSSIDLSSLKQKLQETTLQEPGQNIRTRDETAPTRSKRSRTQTTTLEDVEVAEHAISASLTYQSPRGLQQDQTVSPRDYSSKMDEQKPRPNSTGTTKKSRRQEHIPFLWASSPSITTRTPNTTSGTSDAKPKE